MTTRSLYLLLPLAAASFAACSSSNAPSQQAATGSDDAQFTPAEVSPAPVKTLDHLVLLGVSDYGQLSSMRQVQSSPTADPLWVAKLHGKLDAIAGRQPAKPAPTNPPTVTSATVDTTQDGALYGFNGLGIVDSDTDTGSQAITPPDQGLCAGNGFVIEGVNDAIGVYDVLGQPVGAPVQGKDFFHYGADPAGQLSFASDPKCIFDQATGRFFVTDLRVLSDTSGNLTGSRLDIAVSQSNDPRARWNVFELEATDDGTNGSPNHPHCPCLGDQPLIGSDANGFYVTTNEFGLSNASPGFNGAQIYAMSKTALEQATLPPVVHLSSLVLANGIGFSLQPATTPGSNACSDAGGTQYFLSSLDFNGSLDNRIAVWGLSNTKSLADASPEVTLEHAVLQSETYGFPPPGQQKAGPTPLLSCLAAGTCPQAPGLTSTEQPDQLDTDDDRMEQVVLAGGVLYGALNTVVTVNGAQHAGIAWFAVQAKRLGSGELGGRVAKQGYIALANDDVLYPSIALTDDGRGAIAFEVTGQDYYPSAAYVRFSANKGTGHVRIAGAGAAPLDDWSGYAAFGGFGVARYGDYSSAVLDGDTLWMATEYVPVSCTSLPCAGRDNYTNWGTFVSRIDLDDTLDQ
jgi:hypothetical protein